MHTPDFCRIWYQNGVSSQSSARSPTPCRAVPYIRNVVTAGPQRRRSVSSVQQTEEARVRATTIHEKTFRRGSRTYFNSSRFFPRDVRDDVFILYGFVRSADDFVDATPQDPDGFGAFVARFRAAAAGTPAGDTIIDPFVDLARRRGFEEEWVDAFLASMRMDLERSVYPTVEDSIEYMYGSAEVIGLFMARILDLPRDADPAARMLGRAMQYINFIRDIAEDNTLGRTYLPISETSLPSLSEAAAAADPDEFRRFIREQLKRYRVWQGEGEAGYRLIPRRYRIPIKTAGDMYDWTGTRIGADPFIVYRRKVKPRAGRIVATGLTNLVTA